MTEFQAVLCIKDKPTFTLIQRIADAIQEKVIKKTRNHHYNFMFWMSFVIFF